MSAALPCEKPASRAFKKDDSTKSRDDILFERNAAAPRPALLMPKDLYAQMAARAAAAAPRPALLMPKDLYAQMAARAAAKTD